jgi:ureidoacrylate peracid hydrolase
VTTNCCCESTARSAFSRDYKVVFVSDGTAAFDKDLHEGALRNMRLLFARVLATDEVIAQLRNAEAAPAEADLASLR